MVRRNQPRRAQLSTTRPGVSRDAGHACLRAADGETEAQGGGHERSQSADRAARVGGVQALRLQLPVPSVPCRQGVGALGLS